MKTIEVFLRENSHLKPIAVTGKGKPKIEHVVIQRWQRLFNLIAKQSKGPATLILRITKHSIRVLFSSDSAIQGQTEYYCGSGLYCQSITGDGGLLIESVVDSAEVSRHYAAQSTGVCACFGLPLLWPDDELFGAICLLNNLQTAMTRTYQTIVTELKTAIEHELASIFQQQQLQETSETDPLTLIFNRRKIESVLKTEFDRAKRYGESFSVTMMDLNNFKRINDLHGHYAGDAILKAFVDSVSAKLRETDVLGRWGGDEFILVCPNTYAVDVQQMLKRIRPAVNQDMKNMPAFSDFSTGVAQYEHGDPSVDAIIKRADEVMYQNKSKMKDIANHIA